MPAERTATSGTEAPAGIRVVARPDTCEGNALCMLALPDRFVLDERSRVVVEVAEVDEADYDDVAAAVRNCPTGSLRMEF
ncbi:ferredoxin [Streptomyces muensis]|uniref:Ferredoxin n=1 Tax=Streptomyces muensis TaxID=1077944 RepID=A0A9X1PT80_STRM4|nr:ferredoxin [Streptomyces muensis]MCF1592591.1 ferredoxin [Streptomyces muensis]